MSFTALTPVNYLGYVDPFKTISATLSAETVASLIREGVAMQVADFSQICKNTMSVQKMLSLTGLIFHYRDEAVGFPL
jgi:hypothetical protein